MKKIIITSALILGITISTFAQCGALTKKGLPCKSTIGLHNGFCRTHNPQSIRCGYITKSNQPCKIVVDTFGKRCHIHFNKP